MPDPTILLRSTGDPVEQRQIVSGYVSRNRQAPTSLNDTVWVILPEISTDRLYGPCDFPAIHGTTLPVQGTEVVVAFDGGNFPHIIDWVGRYEDTGWLAPTYEHSWKQKAAAPVAGYRRQNDMVRLRGVIESGANGTVAFTLPAEYRPPQAVRQPIIIGTVTVGSAAIATSGTVTINYSTGTEFCLDSVAFSVD